MANAPNGRDTENDDQLADKPRTTGLGGFSEAGSIQPRIADDDQQDVSDSPTDDPTRPSNPA